MYTKIKLINFQNEPVSDAWILTFNPPADVVVFGQRVFVITNVGYTYKESFVTAALDCPPNESIPDLKIVIDAIKPIDDAGDDKYLEGVPTTIDEAVDALIDFYSNELVEIENMDEAEFQASSHHGAGQFIRNSWYLWWYNKHDCIKWPKSKPGIVASFNDMNIVHADDMASILLTLLHRKIRNKPGDIEELVYKCHNHWKDAGYPDGIPK